MLIFLTKRLDFDRLWDMDPSKKNTTTPLAGVSGSDEHTSASLVWFFWLSHPLTFMCLNIIFDQESSILHLNLLLEGPKHARRNPIFGAHKRDVRTTARPSRGWSLPRLVDLGNEGASSLKEDLLQSKIPSNYCCRHTYISCKNCLCCSTSPTYLVSETPTSATICYSFLRCNAGERGGYICFFRWS